jgi:hypothetical protein
MASQEDLENLKKSIESLKSPIELILDSMADMFEQAESLNEAFVQGRTRMDEMADAIARSAAGVIRLGGDAAKASATMAEIAAGSKRNVIATEEQVSKLFAASTLLNTTSSELVKDFAEVGIEASQIGTNLEGSIDYIQSVGLNAKEVMGDVNANMSKMNRYQFEGGVQGLAKMAAQASMLRLDMQETFNFAEKVLTPEGAIETAAGLQRLGVSIGNLTDPFALMNQSLTDPSGLQDSIIKAAKQFTEFDEKTKTFKINPQGVLMLSEIEKEAGMSAGSLSKAALAAADLDKRISSISPDIQFKSEEDKQLLANMATMKDGEYIVQLKNDQTGIIEQKKLSELTQEQFDALKEREENRPKTLEDIQISQLGVLESMDNSLKAAVAKGTFGVAATPVIRENIMGADRIVTALSRAVDKSVPESVEITKSVTGAIDKMRKLFLEKDSGKLSEKDFSEQIKELEDGVINQAKGLGGKGIDALQELIDNTVKNVKGTSAIEKEFRAYFGNLSDVTTTTTNNAANAVKQKAQAKPISESDILGQSTQSKLASKQVTTTQPSSVNTKTDITGNIKITIDGSVGANGLTQQQLTQIFNSEGFKQYVANLGKDAKGSGVISYQ